MKYFTNNAARIFLFMSILLSSALSHSQTWRQLGIDLDGEASIDYSGFSVSTSADGLTVAIGAPYNDENGSDSGHVRIYSYVNNSWQQLGADIDGEAAGDYSGQSVSLSSDGTIVAIGAPYNDGNGLDSGHVRIYSYVNSSWQKLAADIDGEAGSDYSGESVSLSRDGSIVAIGAAYNE
ncbi:hypothetical protein F0365_03170 [Nonlabens sp. Ci31]|uniref:FG-GAP repeat protein n=1 Tax=Nonlabens sp. Ci31 TaxID=2608253 RepID=UPI001463BFD7|nr:FG-GAP repeat protein [Nonlabens sp. Ci31]QJP33479.1 hypothetical protein F0365_03170 [Nonlabens sp. Ci31]